MPKEDSSSRTAVEHTRPLTSRSRRHRRRDAYASILEKSGHRIWTRPAPSAENLGKHLAQTTAFGRRSLAVDQSERIAHSALDTAFPLVDAIDADSRRTPHQGEDKNGDGVCTDANQSG